MRWLRARHAIAVLAGTLGATACGGGGGAETAAAGEGQALYESHCAMCHGARALGDGAMATTLPVEPPSLLIHLGHHSEAELFRLVREGVPPAMPPAPITEDQIRLVVDHVWTLVPDSMVTELREMQRRAEMGMEMEVEMDTTAR